MSEDTCATRSSYVRQSRLSYGEDRRREFKGHRNLSAEEIPLRLKHSRRAVSRNINGFLNTGQGGKILLGVLDDGTVAGLALSEEQKDHVKISLNDLMSRYTPTVSQSRYHLSFVPVVRDTSEEGDSGVGLDGSEEDSLSALSPSHTSSNTNNSSGGGVRTRGHLMRTSRFCWCDKATRELIIKGVDVPYYVIEISILPFVYDPELPPMVLQLYPIYQNEQGRCYFRGSTSLQEYSYQQVAELTVAEVEEHFRKIEKKLKEEIKMYMTKLTATLVRLAQGQSCDGHVTE